MKPSTVPPARELFRRCIEGENEQPTIVETLGFRPVEWGVKDEQARLITKANSTCLVLPGK